MMSEITTYTKWEEIPNGIATKTTLLRDYGLKLAVGQEPVARKKRYDHKGRHVGYYDLYCKDDCVPKEKATEAQLKALEKARYMAEELIVTCSECQRQEAGRYDWEKVTRKKWIEGDYDHYVCQFCTDKELATEWANHILTLDGVVILDTETTDLYGEIIEIAVIDLEGNVLLNQRIKPVGVIAAGAEAIHGISLNDLVDCPTFPEVYEQIKKVIEQKIVVIYNAAFDRARLHDDCERHGLEYIKFGYDCAMNWYAQWYGDWSRKYEDYKWQPLNGGHDALGDCRATLAVVKIIAGRS
jgi:DNA polymerase-3 subunit epsilon